MKEKDRNLIYRFCELGGTYLLIALIFMMPISVIFRQILMHGEYFPVVLDLFSAALLFITLIKLTQGVMRFKQKLLLILLLIGISLIFLSALNSLNQSFSFQGKPSRYEGFTTWCCYFTLLLSSLSLCEEKHRRWVLYAMLGAGLINGIYTIIQYFEIMPRLTYYSELYREVKLVPGLCGNANFLAANMVMLSGIGAAGFIMAQNWRQELFFLGSLMFSITIVLMTKAMGGLLGLCVVFLLMITVMLKEWKRRPHWCMDSGQLTILGTAAILLVLLIMLVTNHPLMQRFIQQLQDGLGPLLGETISEKSGSGRYLVWKNALNFIPQTWLLGSGPDTFGLLYHSVYPLNNAQYYDKAHNEYLEVLLTMGLPMLLCLLSIYGTCLKNILQRFISKQATWVSAACLFAVCGYLVQAFFGISYMLSAHLLWILLGLGTGQQLNESKMRNYAD